MEAIDLISYPLKVEIFSRSGSVLEYFNYPGIQQLSFNSSGQSGKITSVLIEFMDSNSPIEKIGIMCSRIPLVDKLGEGLTGTQSNALCNMFSAMVHYYDEFACQEMLDKSYEYYIAQDKSYFKREVIDGRICYRSASRV